MRKLTIVAYAGFACALAYGCGTPAKKTASLEPVNDDAGAPAGEAGAFDADIVGLGDAGDSATPPPDGPVTCATTSQKVEVSPVDIYVMLDRSYSMASGGKWAAIVNAVGAVVYDSRFFGLGFGLQYFPQAKLCNPSAYAAPDVSIDILPAQQQQIISSLADNNPWGNSPMVAALEGAMTYTKTWQTAHPARTSVVVLATDGLPDDSCQFVPDGGIPNSLAGVVQVATAGATTSPPVRTFVIGVGDALNDLNQIAVAGGTQSAIIVDESLGVEQQFIDALNQIRKRALSCDYVIPPAEGGTIDFAKVNVRFSPNDGSANQDFAYVDNVANCDKATGGLGWYYDDPTGATRVQLCPASCTAAKAADQGQVDVLFGCEIKTAAPSIPIPKPK